MNLQTQQSPDETSRPYMAALRNLVDAIGQLEGLTRQVGQFALPPDTCDRAPLVVAAVCQELGVSLTFDLVGDGGDRDYAAIALAAEIKRAQGAPELAELDPQYMDCIRAEVAQIRHAEAEAFRLHTVRRPDGTLLTVADAGPSDAPCILISPACAMSYRLFLPWLRKLSGTYRCLLPQTRGTNGRIDTPSVFDERGFDVYDQAEDLMEVIEVLTTGPVHLMGLCGGAVPGLVVAADQPDLVSSLSLWHGDLELGDDAEKTEHQTNLRELLEAAGESRDAAAMIRGMLTSSPMSGVPERIGPLVVRPYATAELFYRYANLTGATMRWDCRSTAARIRQPVLVVTSRDDDTAHPSGSVKLADLLSDARLEVADHGTHLDAFAAEPAQVRLLSSFLLSLPGTA